MIQLDMADIGAWDEVGMADVATEGSLMVVKIVVAMLTNKKMDRHHTKAAAMEVGMVVEHIIVVGMSEEINLGIK